MSTVILITHIFFCIISYPKKLEYTPFLYACNLVVITKQNKKHEFNILGLCIMFLHVAYILLNYVTYVCPVWVFACTHGV